MRIVSYTFVTLSLLCLLSPLPAQVITTDNYDRLVPAGKEVDAIYGDIAIGNAKAKAVIAAPRRDRHANMTVRDVAGCLIDFALSDADSDQLSAFYPGRKQFPFTDADADANSVTVTAIGTDKRPQCKVRYAFASNRSGLSVTSTWTNTTASDWTLKLEDEVRGEGMDQMKSPNGVTDLFYAHFLHGKQAYGIRADGYRIQCRTDRRPWVLRYESIDGRKPVIRPGASFSFTRQIFVAQDLPAIRGLAADSTGGESLQTVEFRLADSRSEPVAHGRITIRSARQSATGIYGTIVTDQGNGMAEARLPSGDYTYTVTVDGWKIPGPPQKLTVEAESLTERVTLPKLQRGHVEARVVDQDGELIPAKIEFLGSGDTPTPNWGPDSAEHFVKNLAYTHNGQVRKRMLAGTYDVIAGHGPEYNAVFTNLTIKSGETTELAVTLPRVVDTSGWVSSDFHSHSSPSGDNTSSQKGRVLNLAAEHVEFAPCTEHNRVSTYAHHIKELQLQGHVASVSGMELTGKPLPLNHQNVFPMKHTPRTQDGGGPVTDENPETQIERLQLWDDRSVKLIQQNHPDLGWLFYDKNGDGTPDEGYSRSFPFMDVVEIHPIDRILTRQRYDHRNGAPFNNNRMLNWLQLLNQGHRIYGVVNTDSHYNFHGSGWLRNWIQSSTDLPVEIDSAEMVTASREGRLVMSNGPYLEVTASAKNGRTAVSGQDLHASSGEVNVDVRVQCANWLDVDRVMLLVNGRESAKHTFTRKDHPDVFSDSVVKFDQKLSLQLDSDAHVIVVTGHATEVLGDVCGPVGGRQHPAALTNPIFIDVDGDGFQPNQDTLDHPLPVKFNRSR